MRSRDVKIGMDVICDGSAAKVVHIDHTKKNQNVKIQYPNGQAWVNARDIRHHVAKEEAKPVPHVVPIAANIRDAIEAMKRVKTMAEIEIGRLEALLDSPSKSTQT